MYDKLEEAFNFFNEHLFGGRLSMPLLALRNEHGSFGSFADNCLRRRNREGINHILALNPTGFDRPEIDILATLVHEMTHLEHQLYGKPGKGGYHNKAWVDLITRVGLIPVSNNDPNKQTGFSVHHTIDPDGPFYQAAQELLATGWTLDWVEFEFTPEQQARVLVQRKRQYVCPKCGVRVWGKPGLKVACGHGMDNEPYWIMEVAHVRDDD